MSKKHILITISLVILIGIGGWLVLKQLNTLQPAVEKNKELSGHNVLKVGEEEIIRETTYTEPYPISWIGWNGAGISLTGITLTESSQSNSRLSLIFKINTAYGGFCTSGLKNNLRLVKNEIDLISPESASGDCADAHTTLFNQEVIFPNMPSTSEFVIKGETIKSEFQELFKVIIPEEGEIQVEPLIG